MRIGTAFPSKWLRADDLPEGKMVQAVIDSVTEENVGSNADDSKPVLWFVGKEKGLVLNKTNASVISAAYGDETDDWHGKPVLLYATEVAFQGKMTPCIRLKIPKGDVRGTTSNGAAPEARRRPAPSQAKAPAGADESGPVYTDADGNEVKEEDIPFAWEGRRQAML